MKTFVFETESVKLMVVPYPLVIGGYLVDGQYCHSPSDTVVRHLLSYPLDFQEKGTFLKHVPWLPVYFHPSIHGVKWNEISLYADSIIQYSTLEFREVNS